MLVRQPYKKENKQQYKNGEFYCQHCTEIHATGYYFPFWWPFASKRSMYAPSIRSSFFTPKSCISWWAMATPSSGLWFSFITTCMNTHCNYQPAILVIHSPSYTLNRLHYTSSSMKSPRPSTESTCTRVCPTIYRRLSFFTWPTCPNASDSTLYT